MKKFVLFGTCLLVSMTGVFADHDKEDKGKGDHDFPRKTHEADRNEGNQHRNRQQVAIPYRTYPNDPNYRTDSGLPPGLAKRGGNLPPGLEKKRRAGNLPPGLEKKQRRHDPLLRVS